MDERKEVNVGKPLIAKLGLHHGFKTKNCLQTCCVANNPFHNQMESSPVASQYYIPSHCQPNSCPGVYHPNRMCAGNIRQLEACSCSGTSRVLATRHEVQNYSRPVGKSNVPVETTDDTVELEFLLSNSLRFPEQQQPWRVGASPWAADLPRWLSGWLAVCWSSGLRDRGTGWSGGGTRNEIMTKTFQMQRDKTGLRDLGVEKAWFLCFSPTIWHLLQGSTWTLFPIPFSGGPANELRQSWISGRELLGDECRKSWLWWILLR